jgi:hypothetical protein
MDVLLGKTYSFDNEVKDSTLCARECGNKFLLSQIDSNKAAFDIHVKEVRFMFLCCNCGNQVELHVVIDEEKVQPIFAPDEDRIEGVHFSFFNNIPLNFDYADEAKNLYAEKERKEIKKKPINPNRIFRDRKRKSFAYCSSNSRPYEAFRKSQIEVGCVKREQELKVLSGEFKEKFDRHMAQYQREIIELEIPENKIKHEGRWPDWIEVRKPKKEITTQQGRAKEINSDDQHDDEFLFDDTDER